MLSRAEAFPAVGASAKDNEPTANSRIGIANLLAAARNPGQILLLCPDFAKIGLNLTNAAVRFRRIIVYCRIATVA